VSNTIHIRRPDTPTPRINVWWYSVRIWVSSNSTLQKRFVRWRLPKLYKHYINRISKQCETKSTLIHLTQWRQPKCYNYAARRRPQWRRNFQHIVPTPTWFTMFHCPKECKYYKKYELIKIINFKYSWGEAEGVFAEKPCRSCHALNLSYTDCVRRRDLLVP